jgi:uncharacterized membrane protein YdjX (TVP38/TMEM64 family)
MVDGMTDWYPARRMGWPAKAVIAVGVLAVLLVAAIPVAFLAGLIMMLLGHVIGGLAVFGASILAAAVAVVIAGVGGVAQLRKVVSRQRYKVVQLLGSDYTRL